MSDCICEGNWRNIIKDHEPLFDRIYFNAKGEAHTFIGVMHSKDDYYYCMLSMTGALQRLSCVGYIEAFGYTLEEDV